MAQTNVRTSRRTGWPRTHEGAPAERLTPEAELRRSCMACLLWESTFYESGVTIADRIKALVPKVLETNLQAVPEIAIEARGKMKLRHLPLMLCRELARHKALTADTLAAVIQRADELAEFLALYWADGKTPLAGQVKKGLAAAFRKFDAYQLAKYDRSGEGKVRLRDVLFLSHAKPADDEQAALWKQLVDQTLPAPDTWEVSLSSGGDPQAHWTRLLMEHKLGAMALMRNLRNMEEAKVDRNLIIQSLQAMKAGRVLPFRFVAAAQEAKSFEPALEKAMFRCLADKPKLPGLTVICVDTSGSMDYQTISKRSKMKYVDAAAALAMFAREICEDVRLISFADQVGEVAPRRGFALRDAIKIGQFGHGTDVRAAVVLANSMKPDRIIIVSDMQSATPPSGPHGRGYMLNVAANQFGVSYGAWTEISGFSEAVLDYIRVAES